MDQSFAVTASRISANFWRAAARRLVDVFRGDLVGGRFVAVEDLARDGLAVDLVGTVVEAPGTREPVHRLERQIGRVAERAVRLDGPVDHVVEDTRRRRT